MSLMQTDTWGAKAARHATELLLGDPYADDPVGWTTEKRGKPIWSKQVEILNSVRDNRFTAVHSMHGTGKSWTAADVCAWWIDAHPIGEAFVVSSAPSTAQVEAILWREIGKCLDSMPGMPGHLAFGGYPKWMIGKEIVGYGRKPTDYVDPTKAMQAFQGIHTKYVLVVLDEACGIPKWLWDAVDTLVTNEYSRVLVIGNPDDPASQFEKVCRPGSGWNVIHIGAEHLPCVTGEPISQELADVLTGLTWIEERRKRWGETSPLFVSKVLGLFPEIADDTLINPSLIREAHLAELDGLALGRYGADIARMGKDFTTVYRNRDGVIRKVLQLGKTKTTQTKGALRAILDRHPGNVPMWIDVAGGLGAGPYDDLASEGYPVHAFNGGNKPFDGTRFLNRRAETYWLFKERLERGEVDLDPQDEDLASQLMSMKWKYSSRGLIQIESKEDMAKRGLPSPDHADSATMSDIRPTEAIPAAEQDLEPDLTSDLLDRPM